jgi:hypothetical protein
MTSPHRGDGTLEGTLLDLVNDAEMNRLYEPISKVSEVAEAIAKTRTVLRFSRCERGCADISSGGI